MITFCIIVKVCLCFIQEKLEFFCFTVFSVSFQRYEDKEDILRRSKLIRGFSEGTTGTPGVPAMGTQVNNTIQDHMA